MAVIYVGSAAAGAGKTGVAAAIARKLAYAGTPVRLVRLLEDGGNAAADAAWFGSLDFAPGSPILPLDTVPTPLDGETIVAEGPLAVAPAQAKVVVVGHGKAPTANEGSIGMVVTGVDGLHGARVTDGPPLVIELGEDRPLAGFSVSDVRSALNAEVLVESDLDRTSDYLVIAPIGSDAGHPYFRRFESQTVVVRFDKTDQHLAALKAEPNLLVLTGGRRPSDYLFDAASASGVPVLLSRTDTENTVIALEGIFDHTRFHGERKLDRMAELLEDTGLFQALA